MTLIFELGLLLHGGGGCGRSGDSGGGGGNAEGLLQGVDQIGQLEDGEGLDFFDQSGNFFACHFDFPPKMI